MCLGLGGGEGEGGVVGGRGAGSPWSSSSGDVPAGLDWVGGVICVHGVMRRRTWSRLDISVRDVVPSALVSLPEPKWDDGKGGGGVYGGGGVWWPSSVVLKD